jgi:hypothetical protein
MALQALPRCWVHLAGVSGGVKSYSGFIIIIKIYPALSATVGGQDGMDCSRHLWMTCSINSTSCIIDPKLEIELLNQYWPHLQDLNLS